MFLYLFLQLDLLENARRENTIAAVGSGIQNTAVRAVRSLFPHNLYSPNHDAVN